MRRIEPPGEVGKPLDSRILKTGMLTSISRNIHRDMANNCLRYIPGGRRGGTWHGKYRRSVNMRIVVASRLVFLIAVGIREHDHITDGIDDPFWW